ncbi:MAG: hypothetical protein LBR98_05465 [Syntrophomonadaceae bacterium]|jgi:hypothetical protein|nr:hypothetical protein [Syntrophomonadaceae bacterium]
MKNKSLFFTLKGGIFIILALCLALSSTACGTSSAPTTTTPAGSKAYNYFKENLPNKNEFYIAFNMEGIDTQNTFYQGTAEVALKGENIYTNVTIGSNNRCAIFKEGTLYFLNKRAQTYSKAPKEELENPISDTLFDSERLNALTYTSGEVEIGGVKYASEEYVDGSSQVKYCFDDSNVLKYIINNSNGNDIQMEIVEFSGQVTDEMFNFPIGFTEDITTLEIPPQDERGTATTIETPQQNEGVTATPEIQPQDEEATATDEDEVTIIDEGEEITIINE